VAGYDCFWNIDFVSAVQALRDIGKEGTEEHGVITHVDFADDTDLS